MLRGAFGRGAAASGTKGKGRAARLEAVIAELDGLNRATERDFLKIGENLAGFTQTVKAISSELTGLADQLLGEQGSRASEALTGALDHARKMVSSAEASAALLGGMRQNADRVKGTLDGFKDTLSTFHILGVLTRIETSHLGNSGADFGHLADDVKALADTIQGKIENAMATAARLIPPIEAVLQGVSAHLEGKAKDLPRILAEVLADLEAFRAMQNRTREATLRLEGRYSAIAEAFNDLIVSIQFHDITRQQVEHVSEALRRLCPAHGGAGGAVSRDHGDPVAILSLQSMQLADAGGRFAASVASVGQSLERIAANILEMDSESRALSGVSDDAQNSFFLEMERKCTAIRGALGGCSETEEAARTASKDLAETIDWMYGAIEEIRAIEIQIQWMALNASIRAGHIGAAGDALGTLAGAMQTLASQCRERSDTLTGAVGSISEAAEGLSGQMGEARTSQIGVSLEAIGTVATDLHSASERSFAGIAQIAARCQRLREDISAVRDGFTAGAVFAEAIGRARDMLSELGAGKHRDGPPDGAGHWEHGLADLATHYTMQSERDVHAGVAGTGAGADAVAALDEPREIPAGEASELGENVELF
jgi:methyl-accepting chemotaxis protein